MYIARIAEPRLSALRGRALQRSAISDDPNGVVVLDGADARVP